LLTPSRRGIEGRLNYLFDWHNINKPHPGHIMIEEHGDPVGSNIQPDISERYFLNNFAIFKPDVGVLDT
jgi:hypothetical protein